MSPVPAETPVTPGYGWWYDAADTVLGVIGDCLGQCEYELFVSQGRPPAECSSIAVWPAMSTRAEARVQRCHHPRRESLVVTLTRCCAVVDAQDVYQPQIEDREARCFSRDLDRILRCLACNLPAALKANGMRCDEQLVGEVTFDEQRMGDCYSANIRLDTSRLLGCDCEPPAAPGGG